MSNWIEIFGGVFLFALGFSLGRWAWSSRRSPVTDQTTLNGDRKSLFLFSALIALSILFVIFSFAVVSYVQLFLWPADSDGSASLGQRGDFFGGFLNPLLTFFTFLAFIYTLSLQRLELQESREQFRRSTETAIQQSSAMNAQNYQTAFFQMMISHNDIVNAIRVTDPVKNIDVNGRSAFRVFYSAIRRLYREKCKKFPGAADSKRIGYSYEYIYRKYQYELGHYFRSLYNTIIMLESGPDAAKYVRLLRSQISNQELLVIYYNCAVSPHGERLKELAERYQLFNNMPPHLLDQAHGSLMGENAFGPGGYAAILASHKPKVRGDMSVAD
jgi:hypothetical protein